MSQEQRPATPDEIRRTEETKQALADALAKRREVKQKQS